MELYVRDLTITDIKNVSSIAKSVFMEFESQNYGELGVENFIDFVKEENLIENYKKKLMDFVGCFYKEKVIGKCTSEKLVGIIATRSQNHISLLFVDKKFQHKGIAKLLVNKIIEKNNNRSEYLTVNSSHYAIDIYRKLGFYDTGKEQVVDGMLFTPMKYYIKKIKSDISIRRANICDLDTLIDLRIKQLEDEGADIKDQEEIRKNLRSFYKKALNDGSLILFVGEDKQKIIATGGVIINNVVPYFGNENGKVASIVNMYTDLYYRRQKIANRILEVAIKAAKKNNIKIFRVSASKYGKFLYQSFGFYKKENSYEFIS